MSCLSRRPGSSRWDQYERATGTRHRRPRIDAPIAGLPVLDSWVAAEPEPLSGAFSLSVFPVEHDLMETGSDVLVASAMA